MGKSNIKKLKALGFWQLFFPYSTSLVEGLPCELTSILNPRNYEMEYTGKFYMYRGTEKSLQSIFKLVH